MMKIIPGILLILLCFSASLKGADQSAQDVKGKIPILSDTVKAPVVILKDTLFYISSPAGTFSSTDRANRINQRLHEILRKGNVVIDSFYLYQSERNYYILYNDLPIMVVFPNDTAGYGIFQEELALRYLKQIQTGFSNNILNYHLATISRNVLNTGIIILAVLVVVFILNWIFRRFTRFLEGRREKYFKGWNIRNYPLFSSEQQFRFIRNLINILKFGLIILIVFIALPMIFTMFPATEGVTRKLVSMVLNPVKNILNGIVNYMPDLITIIVIYFIFHLILKGLRFLKNEIASGDLVIPGFFAEWAQPTFMIIRFILYIFMFIIIFPFLPGSESAVFQGVSVFVGLLISIGSSSAISNAVAGLVITYMRPFKVGDRIKIDEIMGTVMEKSALVTRIRTIKNEDVTIPNAKVLTSHTVNYSDPAKETGLIIHTTVTIGYDAPWRTVHSLLLQAARDTSGVLKKPAPFVLQTSLDDFYISYQVNVYISNAYEMLKIKSDLHQNIQDSFNRGGVEIMSPHYRAERDGNEITIPKNWEEQALKPDEFPVNTAPPAKKPGRKPKL